MKVYLPESLPENKVDIFFPLSPRRILSVLIRVSDTKVKAEASVHMGCPPDYTFFSFLAHVSG